MHSATVKRRIQTKEVVAVNKVQVVGGYLAQQLKDASKQVAVKLIVTTLSS
jgi:5,10-methylene-tetrahydrofolate dehydrogenase/methenyl tetrahydrofolate cyclohydrolase